MDSIIAALIGLFGGVVTLFFKRMFEEFNFLNITKDRRQALTGIWKGIVIQNLKDNTQITLNVTLDLKVNWNHVKGNGSILYKTNIYRVELKGAFRNDKFLKMEYENIDRNIIQFGSFVFHLSDDCKEMQGNFVGYGHTTNSIIYGNTSLNKQ